MTQPLEENVKMSLVDCFVLGLLKLKKISNLKIIDFSRFEKGKFKKASRLAFVL